MDRAAMDVRRLPRLSVVLPAVLNTNGGAAGNSGALRSKNIALSG